MTMTKKLARRCRQCGRRFKGKTKRSDYCSGACKQRGYRLRRDAAVAVTKAVTERASAEWRGVA